MAETILSDYTTAILSHLMFRKSFMAGRFSVKGRFPSKKDQPYY